MVLSIEQVSPRELDDFLRENPAWRYERAALVRDIRFSSYMDGIQFACRVGELAEEANHHPEITIGYKVVTLRWWTHKIGDVARGDVIMARRVEERLRETPTPG